MSGGLETYPQYLIGWGFGGLPSRNKEKGPKIVHGYTEVAGSSPARSKTRCSSVGRAVDCS
jgi:hypothetical protein